MHSSYCKIQNFLGHFNPVQTGGSKVPAAPKMPSKLRKSEKKSKKQLQKNFAIPKPPHLTNSPSYPLVVLEKLSFYRSVFSLQHYGQKTLNKEVKVCEVLLVRPRKIFCDMS